MLRYCKLLIGHGMFENRGTRGQMTSDRKTTVQLGIKTRPFRISTNLNKRY